MTIRFKIFTGLMACVFIFLAGQNAKAEESSGGLLQELKNQVFQAISRELVKQVKSQFVDQGRSESIQSARPQALTALNQPMSPRSDSDTMSMIATLGRQMLNSGAIDSRTLSPVMPNLPNEISPEERPLRAGVVAVTTNTENPVKSLTVKQAKMVFTGEYTNWSQVGGPDLPIKVVICQANALELEDLMKAPVAPDAATLRYASLLVPAVDRMNGAIGFITTRKVEQVEFINRHQGLQKIAIRASEQSPAITPSVGAIHNGSYPMVVDQHGTPAMPVKAKQSSARISRSY